MKRKIQAIFILLGTLGTVTAQADDESGLSELLAEATGAILCS